MIFECMNVLACENQKVEILSSMLGCTCIDVLHRKYICNGSKDVNNSRSDMAHLQIFECFMNHYYKGTGVFFEEFAKATMLKLLHRN